MLSAAVINHFLLRSTTYQRQQKRSTALDGQNSCLHVHSEARIRARFFFAALWLEIEQSHNRKRKSSMTFRLNIVSQNNAVSVQLFANTGTSSWKLMTDLLILVSKFPEL